MHEMFTDAPINAAVVDKLPFRGSVKGGHTEKDNLKITIAT